MSRTKAVWTACWDGGTGWGIYGNAQRVIRTFITLDNDHDRIVELMLTPSEARDLGNDLLRQADKVDKMDVEHPLERKKKTDE